MPCHDLSILDGGQFAWTRASRLDEERRGKKTPSLPWHQTREGCVELREGSRTERSQSANGMEKGGEDDAKEKS
jgi:hypothetical protein